MFDETCICGCSLELGKFENSEYCSLNCAIKDLQLKHYITRKKQTCEECGKEIPKGEVACKSKKDNIWFCGIDDALRYYDVI